jgi:hypothetical protein
MAGLLAKELQTQIGAFPVSQWLISDPLVPYSSGGCYGFSPYSLFMLSKKQPIPFDFL